MKTNSQILLASVFTLASGVLLNATPTKAAVVGSIGLSGDLSTIGTGYCPASTGSGGPVILCTDPGADVTRPLTTLDFQKIATGNPDLFPDTGEASITNATGIFETIDPPPLGDYAILKDLGTFPVETIPVPEGFALVGFPVPDLEISIINFGRISNNSEPQFRWELDVETVSFPNYSQTTNSVGTVTTTVSIAYTGLLRDTETGISYWAEGAYSSDFVNETEASLQAFFATPGATRTGISWSSTLVASTSVPESSNLIALLGLGLGGSVLLSRKQLLKK